MNNSDKAIAKALNAKNQTAPASEELQGLTVSLVLKAKRAKELADIIQAWNSGTPGVPLRDIPQQIELLADYNSQIQQLSAQIQSLVYPSVTAPTQSQIKPLQSQTEASAYADKIEELAKTANLKPSRLEEFKKIADLFLFLGYKMKVGRITDSIKQWILTDKTRNKAGLYYSSSGWTLESVDPAKSELKGEFEGIELIDFLGANDIYVED